MNRHERAEHLSKAALSIMAERHIAPTPDNFELFYAYAAGENPDVAHVIGDMIAGRRPLTPAVLAELRQRFFPGLNTAKETADINAKVTNTLEHVLGKLQTAGQDTVAYGRALNAASGELGGDHSPANLRKLVDGLISATKSMEDRATVLEVELQKSSHEVQDLRTKLETVRKESLTDTLTGILNRKAFDIELDKAVQRASEASEHLCVLMCDIDHFKNFNDTWGHQTGDHVLRLVAACISENVKGRDTAARFGGEEFAIILPQTPLNVAVSLANQIRLGVEGKKLVKKSTGDILGTITISIGVATWAAGEPASVVVQRADSCLYAAKNAGRNRVTSETEMPKAAAA